MPKFLKELTDFSGLDEEEFSPSDDKQTLTRVLFVILIVLMVVIYWAYQWSSVAAGVPTT